MKAQIHAFSCLDQTQAVSQTLYANLTQNNHLVILRGNETIEVYKSDNQEFICKYSPANQLKIARFIKVRNPNQGFGDFLVLEIAGKLQFITLRMDDNENEIQVVSLHNFQNDVRLHEAASACPQHGFFQSFNFEKEVFISQNLTSGENRGERGRPRKQKTNIGTDSNELGMNISEQFVYFNDFSGNDFRVEIISGWSYLADNDKLIVVQYKVFNYSETNSMQIDPLYCDVKCPSNLFNPFDILYPSQIYDLNRCVNLQNPLPAYLSYFQKQLAGINSLAQSDSKIIRLIDNKIILTDQISQNLDEKSGQKITGKQNKKIIKQKTSINDDEERQEAQQLDEIQEKINIIPNNDNIQANLNYFFKKSVSYAKHPLQEQLLGQINQQIQNDGVLNVNQMTGQIMNQVNPFGSHNKRLEPGPCIFAQEATIFEIHDIKILNQSFSIEENNINQFLQQDLQSEYKNKLNIKDSDIYASMNIMILHKVHIDKVTGTDSKVPCFNLNIFDIQVFRDLHPASQIKNIYQGIKQYKSPKIGLRTIVQRLNYYSRFIVGPPTELSSMASLQINNKLNNNESQQIEDDKTENVEKQIKPFDETISKNLKALSETDLIFVVSNISIYAIRFRVEQSKISKIFGQDYDTISENLDSVKVLTTLVTEVQTSSICKIVEGLNENERKPEKIIQQPLKDVVKVNLGEQIYGTKVEKQTHFVKGVVCQKIIDKRDLELRFDGSTRFHSLPNNRLLVCMQNQEKWILHFQFDQADLDVASVHFVKINLQNQIPFPIMPSCISVFLSDQKRMAIEQNEDKEDPDKVWRDGFKTNKNSQEFQICISSYYHDTLVFKLLPEWSLEQKLANEDSLDGSQLEQRQKTENSEVVKKKYIKNPIPQSYSLQCLGSLGSTLTPITNLLKINRIQEDLTFTDLMLIQGSQYCSSIVIVKDYLIQKKGEKQICGISTLPLEQECLYKLDSLQKIQSLDSCFGQLIFLRQGKLDNQRNLINDEGVTRIYEFNDDNFSEVNYDTYKYFERDSQTIGLQVINFSKAIPRSKDQIQIKKQLIVQANLNSNKLQVVELFEQNDLKQTRTHSILEAVDQDGNNYTIQEFLVQENSQSVICLANYAQKQKIFSWKLFNQSQTISSTYLCPKNFKIVRIIENQNEINRNIPIFTIDQANNFQIFKLNGDVLQLAADYGQALALQSQDLNVKYEKIDGTEIIDFQVDYFGQKLYLLVLYSNCQFRLYQETVQFQFKNVNLQPKAEAVFSNCYSQLKYSQQKRFIYKNNDQFIILPPKDDFEIQNSSLGLKPSGITISFRSGRPIVNLLGLNQLQENLEGFVSLTNNKKIQGKTFLQIIKNKNQENRLMKFSYPIQGSFDPLHNQTPQVSELCLKQIYPTVNEKPISIKFCQISSCKKYIVLACFEQIQSQKKPRRQIIDQGFSPDAKNMAPDLVYSIYVYKMPQAYHHNSTNTSIQTFNKESALFCSELLCQLKKFEENELINEMKFLTLEIEGVKKINDQMKYKEIKEKDEFLIVSTIKQDEKMEKSAYGSQIYVMKLQEKDKKFDLTVIQKIQKEKLISGLASYKGRLITVQNMQQDFQIVLQQVKIIKTEENTLKYFLDMDSTLQFPQTVQNMATFLAVEKMGPLRQLGDESLFDTESIFVGDIYRGFQIFTCKNIQELNLERIYDSSRIDLQKRMQSKISGHCLAIHAFNLLRDNALQEKTDKLLKTVFILYAAKDGSLRVFQDGISKNLECTGFQHLKDNILQVLPLEIESSTEMLNRNFLILPRRGGLISVSQVSFLFFKTIQGIAIELSKLQADSGISPLHMMTVQGRDKEYAGGNIQTMQNLGINPSAALLSYPRSQRAQVEMIDRGFRNMQLPESGEKKHEKRNQFSQHQFNLENTFLDSRIVLPRFFAQDYQLQENIALQLGFVDRQTLFDLLFSEI